MLPADERLDADNRATLKIYFWLVVQYKFLSGQSATQACLDRLPLNGQDIHVLLEKFEIIASVFLGRIHRGVRTLDQGFNILSIVWEDADADTRADIQILLANVVRLHD